MKKVDQEKLSELLEILNTRESLVIFREDHRIKFQTLTNEELDQFLADLEVAEGQERIISQGSNIKEIADATWEEIVEERERLPRTERVDRIAFSPEISALIGLKEFILVQEGYAPPGCGVILFFENQTSGIEAEIKEDGEINFLLNALVPENIRQFIRASILVGYHDRIVRPEAGHYRDQREEIEDQDEEAIEEVSEEIGDQIFRVNPVVKRQAHTMKLPAGKRASAAAVLRGLRDGRFYWLETGGPETFRKQSEGQNPDPNKNLKTKGSLIKPFQEFIRKIFAKNNE